MLQNDSEGEYCTLFAGKELYPERHIYPGKATTCPAESLPDDFDTVWMEIVESLREKDFDLYTQNDGVSHGVILSCFD